jgi:hypothetical protein
MNRIVNQGIWVGVGGFFDCIVGKRYIGSPVSRGLKIPRRERVDAPQLHMYVHVHTLVIRSGLRVIIMQRCIFEHAQFLE